MYVKHNGVKNLPNPNANLSAFHFKNKQIICDHVTVIQSTGSHAWKVTDTETEFNLRFHLCTDWVVKPNEAGYASSGLWR